MYIEDDVCDRHMQTGAGKPASAHYSIVLLVNASLGSHE